MTDSTLGPTLEQRLSWHDVHLFVALDTIDEIAKRITNLVVGRDITIVQQWVDHGRRSFPDVKTNLRVDVTARGAGLVVSKQPEFPHCGMSVYLAPGLSSFGVGGSFRTEREAAKVYHDAEAAKGVYRNWALAPDGVTFVHIVGGQTYEDVGQNSVIEILRINENDVAEQIIVKPRVEQSDRLAEAEGKYLERLADHIEVSRHPLTADNARNLADCVRYDWKSPLLVPGGPA